VISQREPVFFFISRIAPPVSSPRNARPHRSLAGAPEPSERGPVLGPQLVHLVILVLVRVGHADAVTVPADDLRRDGVLVYVRAAESLAP
jgi:hypothetical protein